MDERVVDRLDRLIGLYELANWSMLASARSEIRSDAVVAALLDASEEWQGVGVLKSSVARQMGISEKTVQRRIAELVNRRLLQEDGAGASRRIKSAGLV